jgi:Kef-type K+ transport system membrane component KefB
MAPTVAFTSFAARSILSSSDSGSSGLPTIAIAGFVVAGVIGALVLGWFVVRLIRKRAQRKRDNARGAAFLSVKGIVKEGTISNEKDAYSP